MKQLTVLTANQPGVLASIAQALAERSVNIEALDAEGIDEHGVVVLTVDRYDEALRALRDSGFTAISQDALLIRLEDKPGALAKIAVRLKDAGIDVRSMHIIRRDRGGPMVSLVASDNIQAAALLADCLVGGRE
ncbi:MAG: ACT domain-containing protein [Verrucomicrobiales bacterium]